MNPLHLQPLLLAVVASCLVPAGFLRADSLVATCWPAPECPT
jgi:hypothetical protein